MTIFQQGVISRFEAASGTTVDLAYPEGIVAGELITAHIANSTNVAPQTSPGTGWVVAAYKNGQDVAGPSVTVWTKVADGTETGTVSFNTGDTSGRVTGYMMRWSGVDTSNIQDVAYGVVGGYATTVTTPSLTTVTNGAMLLYSTALGAASSADIAGPVGPTKIAGTTGTGRRLSIWTEPWPTAGATGTRDWTTTQTLQWSNVVMALRPSAFSDGYLTAPRATATASAPAPSVLGGTPPQSALIRSVNDVPGTNSMVVAANATNCTSMRLKVSTDSTLATGAVFGPAVTPDAQGNAQLTITGLTPGLRYYYRVAMTSATYGEVLDDWAIGEFKTNSGAQQDFTIAFGSCTNATDSVAFSAIATKKPDLFMHLGDEYYADGSGTTVDNFRLKMNDKRTAANQKAVYRTSGASFTPSDHDLMNNNVNAGNTNVTVPNYNQVYREMTPTTGLPGTLGLYRSFSYGRVRFLRIDRRSFASAPDAVDDANKTCLGATQKQWLKDQITNATEPVILIQNADPWIGAAQAIDDGWFGYTTERTELANFFIASGKHIAMVGGDMHALAADDGTNAPGGITIFQASPFHQASSIKGGPYSAGPYPASGSTTVQQYGWIDVTDIGTSITLAFKGFSGDNTLRVSLTKTFDTQNVVTGNMKAVRAGAAVSGTVSAVRGGVLTAASSVGRVAVTKAPPVAGNWTLAFEDNFDGPALSSQWATSWFGGGTMNNAATVPANLSISGGYLLLRLENSNSGAMVNTDPSQVSGGFTFTTGYAEARIWFPGPTGTTDIIYNWPAWWTDGQPTWPANGEIDIAEPQGYSGGSSKMSAAYHGPGPIHPGAGIIAGAWANSWHKYAVHRKVGSIDVYFDDVIVWTVATTDGEKPHFLILNIGSTPSTYQAYGAGYEMKVDYVRVWV